ncbi:amidase [Muricoccus vinaceus]|uniref:Amidase n=1 Tax=Muricoccus vinaceus TaxID=424704 RepID=A0ABV6IY68_9PROT
MIPTATEAARRIADGDLTAEAYLRACLDHVAAREPAVRAFAAIDTGATLRSARGLDAGPARGPLHGIPFAVKDVIDTADLPTGMGSSIWNGHRPRVDAACVALSRAAGGVMLGKTVTAELAYVSPGATTNPHDAAHTPGGSSSGSAAAVAAGMVPLALGTQTGGSVLRPASFCGVVGLKPSFGAIPRPGMKLMADSLDTIGLMARTVEDAALFLAVLTADPPEPLPDIPAPRIGLCRTALWELAQPAAREAVEDAARRLEAAGATLRDVSLPPDFAGLTEARVTINDHEIARALADEWTNHREGLSERLAATVEKGRAIPRTAYAAAQGAAEFARARFPDAMAGCDALLTLGAAGEAPEGLASTGDSRFQGLWTLLHGPAIGLPTHRGPKGLPVGVQLVAPRHADRRLLAVARWAMDRLGSPFA